MQKGRVLAKAPCSRMRLLCCMKADSPFKPEEAEEPLNRLQSVQHKTTGMVELARRSHAQAIEQMLSDYRYFHASVVRPERSASRLRLQTSSSR